MLPLDTGRDVYEVQATRGHVTVRGSSGVAICRGVYDYLKEACHVQVSWSTQNPRVTDLPAFPFTRVVTPNLYRHYFNVCTFGYTTVWWNWARWQREIDWMAFHGINMPLAMNGQEKIWQTVFHSLGVPQESLDHFFSGPAFLPWHRMGNLDAHGGPLPQSWIDGQATLQEQILAGERSLGMTPVVPGFSGFVPVDFDKYHPEVKLSSPTAWAGFAPTKFIGPEDPMFVQIGERFIREYRKAFGSDHLYLCDTFNEQNPQFPDSTKLRDLAACGRAVYDSIHRADPDGTWVMQGWLFYNARDYWRDPEVGALLDGIPAGHMIVLDLASNEHETWREHQAIRDTGWIYNTLHNYGQNTALYGNIGGMVATANRAEDDPSHGRMLGMGLTPEGIDQNPVIYETMTDEMWHRVAAAGSVQDYVSSRYGKVDGQLQQPALKAWEELSRTIYGPQAPGQRARWRDRPSFEISSPPDAWINLRESVLPALLSEASDLGNRDAYRRDLVDLTKTFLGGIADIELTAALYSAGSDPAAYEAHKHKFFGVLDDIDRLLATRPEHRLSSWIAAARAWGKSPAERDLMERNARLQVTVWGGPDLHDYANKEWAGLTRDFVEGRWKLFFSALDKSDGVDRFQAPDFARWELNWANSTAKPTESWPEDSLVVARTLFDKYRNSNTNLKSLLHLDDDRGIAVGKKVWDSGHSEPGGDPKWAVDGDTLGRYWAASPAPQWIEVDLGHATTVTGVRLFPYFGDGRYYQYTIELSIDGEHWDNLVDESNNTRVSTIKGYLHTWPAAQARFVRVTMLRNSANIGVHLYELRVLGQQG